LLRLKYGEDEVPAITSLFELFGVNNCLELDLVLLHGSPIVKRWQFSHDAADIVNALTESPRPGLYVLVVRYWDSKRVSREGGHRTALVIRPAGGCRFYDPRWGEMSFSALDQFAEWFADYWTTELWDYFLQRGAPPSTLARLFALGGALSPAGIEKCRALQERFPAYHLNAEELFLWLDNLRLRTGGEHSDSVAKIDSSQAKP
jgi:hypothetical protein